MVAWMQRDIVRQNGSKKALPTVKWTRLYENVLRNASIGIVSDGLSKVSRRWVGTFL